MLRLAGLIPQPRVNLRLDLEFDVFARRIGNGKSSVWKAPRDPPAPPYEGGERVWDCVGGRAGDVFGTASAWRCAGIASGLVSQVGLSRPTAIDSRECQRVPANAFANDR